MAKIVITGSAGLIGSESSRFFSKKGFDIIGIDNDMRAEFFGKEASTAWNLASLKKELPNYIHASEDIRDQSAIEKIFGEYNAEIKLIIHTAAQPSHDWAARDPFTDFTINANGTLVLLEMVRKYCPEAVFIFTSTNKVYGDAPNNFTLVEKDSRWELDSDNKYAQYGFDETLTIDQSKHSLFGASKLSADIMVQEYGRYFGMKTVCFRGGCLTGPRHSGTQLHGFLAYLMKCTITNTPYNVFGYKGKQVRDNIHSEDLVSMFWAYYNNPQPGEVYNVGGSRHSNCSMLEAIALCEELTGNRLNWKYSAENRSGDHIWWISDVRKFNRDYPDWEYKYNLNGILKEIHNSMVGRFSAD